MNLLKAKQQITSSDIATVVAVFGLFVVLGLARSVHYLLFHTIVEIFAVVVSLSIYILTWTGSRYFKNGYLIVLGAAFGAIAFIDVFHLVTYKGMNLFPAVTLNYPTQFWLSGRFLEALAILIAPLFINKKLDFFKVSAAFVALGIASYLAVMNNWFPATFIEGSGLTPFKIYSEYFIITMMGAGLYFLIQCKSQFHPRIFWLLSFSIILSVAAEFCFTRYTSFFDFANELGHYLRFLSSTLTFLAIVISGVRHPLDSLFRDINERQIKLEQLNQAVAQSEERLNQAQQVAKLGSWHLNIPENKLDWSTEAYRVFGEPLDKPITFEVFAKHIHPDDSAAVFAAWERALKGAPYEIEHRILVGNETRWVKEVAEITFNPEGVALFGTGTVQDISERKQIEVKLNELEERYRLAFSISPDSININRLSDGLFVDVNEAFLRMTGLSRDEVVGKSSIELNIWHNVADRQRLVEALQKDGRCNNLEANFIMKDGHILPALMSAHLMTLAGEQCILSVTRDITERKKIEQQLRESESRMKEMFENLSSGVAVYSVSQDGENFFFTAFNKAAERIENLSRHEVIGKNVQKIFPSIAEFGLLEIFKRVWRSGIGEHFPITWYQDGAIAGWRDNYIYKLQSGEVVAIYNDVTKEKQAEERMHYLAHHDALTGLPNRALATDRLRQAITKAK